MKKIILKKAIAKPLGHAAIQKAIKLKRKDTLKLRMYLAIQKHEIDNADTLVKQTRKFKKNH